MAEMEPIENQVKRDRIAASKRPDRSGFGNLNSTIDGKHFYANSGLISVDNNETVVIGIPNIGERDILLCVNPFFSTFHYDNMTLKIKNNGSIIYQAVFDVQKGDYHKVMRYIIPANTSLEITLENATSSPLDVGVSCYGDYL